MFPHTWELSFFTWDDKTGVQIFHCSYFSFATSYLLVPSISVEHNIYCMALCTM
uniref:Uncharacterized protein n=1 Tax=Arundo donax TaxID=35708 RepID=A0A0A9AEN3_ARUDO